MTVTHQITCAGEDCPEWSITSSMRPVSRQELAADHRAQLVDEGWTDIEGRDYCPAHAINAASPQ